LAKEEVITKVKDHLLLPHEAMPSTIQMNIRYPIGDIHDIVGIFQSQNEWICQKQNLLPMIVGFKMANVPFQWLTSYNPI